MRKKHLIIAATCVVQLLAFTLPIFVASSSVAAPAPSKKAPAPRKAAPSPRKKRIATPSVTQTRSRDLTKETSLQTIGITPFFIQKSLGSEVSPAQTIAVAKQVVAELSAKSYLKATYIEGSGLSAQAREQLVSNLSSANLDGAVTGDLSPEGVNFFVISKSGLRLGSGQVQVRLRLVKDATLKALASNIVDEIVRAIPYRGFLTREIEDGVFELNIGTDHGIAKGQKLRVFDFAESNLTSNKVDKGEVEVTEVTANTSTVEVTSNNHQVKPYYKVGFDERARGMVVNTQTPTRGYGLIGGQLISVTGTSDPNFADKSYNMKATPGLVLGLGWNKTSLRAILAQARNEDVDLVFTEIIGYYRLWEKMNGFNTFTLSAGARFARFGVTTKRTVTTPLESSTSLAPAIEGRLDRLISGPVRAFVAGNLYYPMFNTGNGASTALIFAYGAGGEIGAALDLTPRVSLEVGAKTHFIRRPVSGQSAVQERYSQVFADVIARF